VHTVAGTLKNHIFGTSLLLSELNIQSLVVNELCILQVLTIVHSNKVNI